MRETFGILHGDAFGPLSTGMDNPFGQFCTFVGELSSGKRSAVDALKRIMAEAENSHKILELERTFHNRHRSTWVFTMEEFMKVGDSGRSFRLG
jgi:hypothetical protein